MTTLTEAWRQRDRACHMEAYARYPLCLVEGRGARVRDVEGRWYLDFLSGIAVTGLGHCHPEVVAAVQEQASTLMHVSNLYTHPRMVELAEALVEAGALDRIFFVNSGTEANETAIKLARIHHFRRGQPARQRILSAAGAFHGRTLGSLAATPRRPYQEGFGPLPGGFDSVEYGNAEALERALDDTVAAFLVEPVQGEGGIVLPPPGYLRQARRLTRERGALLIVDEVQCGMGRTGHLFAFQAEGVRPDIITLAKGLGGGLPIGAVAATLEVARSFQPGDHGCTFGANPVCCAAALAVLRILQREDLPGRAGRLGQVFAARLGPLAGSLPWVREVRCRGLMIGIELDRPAAEALERLRREGLLANACGPVLRLLPPLNLSDAELEEGLEILERVLGSLDS